MRTERDERAVSTVITVVILVAVAITVAVAVAYWTGGIAGMYTKSEKIEIQTAYAPLNSTGGYWNITMLLKNSGSVPVTLRNVFVNNKQISSYDPQIDWYYSSDTASYQAVDLNTGLSIESGQEVMVFLIVDGSLFSSGTNLDVKLHSAGGIDYPHLVELV